MHKLFVLTSLIISSFAIGQIEDARRFTEKLCSPEFHGRGYVNQGDSIAAAYIAREFETIGAESIDDTYFQEFSLPVNTFPKEMLVGHNNKLLIPGGDFIVAPSSGGGTLSLTPLLIPQEKILDIEFIKEQLPNLIQGTEYNSILFNTSNLSGDSLTQVRGLERELANYIPVIEVINTKFTWSVSREQNKYPQLQIKRESINWDELKFDVDIHAQFIKDYKSRNVIARIPGKKKCSRSIVFTAHYDHLGRMGSETYFPGANDNASGTAMLTYLARYFKEHPVDHEIIFIAFAGEEAGLVGSKYFVENSLLKLKKIDFLLNLDIMGSGEEGITVVNATLFKEAFEQLSALNTQNNWLPTIKKRGPAANSDHYWFTENGVPSFFIYTMGPNKHYHDIFDTFDELSFKEFEDIAALLIEFVLKQEE